MTWSNLVGVIREALRDWEARRALHGEELAVLRCDIERGLADMAQGRVRDFDAKRIVERGKQRSASSSPSV